MERIRKFQDDGKTILIVTHAVDGIRDLCSQAALLSKGQLAAYGNPSEVIRQYRNKVSRTPEGEKIDHLTAVDIEKVALTDRAGNNRPFFRAGEGMTVWTEMVTNVPVEDPVFSVNIFDAAGQHIFGTNTNLRYMETTLHRGPARLRIDFDMLPMQEGTFTLAVGIHSRDGKTVYAATDGNTSFEMRSDNTEPGRLMLPCTFSMDNLPAVKRATG
jgi:ABC-2 type transport system ATP-binding protein